MKSKMITFPIIEFSENWGNKLDLDEYTTIRILTEFNWKKYCSLKDSVFHIHLKGKFHHRARLTKIEKGMLCQIKDDFLTRDTGEPDAKKRMDIFRIFYNRDRYASQWKEDKTMMIILYFRKIEGLMDKWIKPVKG